MVRAYATVRIPPSADWALGEHTHLMFQAMYRERVGNVEGRYHHTNRQYRLKLNNPGIRPNPHMTVYTLL